MRLFALLLLPAFAFPAVAQDLVAKTDALSPTDELAKFKLPEGFAAQLVASEPDIQKPVQLAFDAKNRLWVTTSHHYPWAAEAGKGTDKLFVLSDFDAKTGKAKTVTVFDDKLNIPIGVLPLPDCKSVIVSECGKILKLTDTDDDGKADKREVLFEGFGFKDTHGMTNSFTLLPDGWVYACHGFANDSKVKGKDGHEVVMNSGHTFRFRPDGSRIEVFTRGQVNPFGIAVDPWLNLYTADCHSKPVTQLIRGAYYDSFGKPDDGLGKAPHVYTHLHNSTGLCGLVYYAADHFPKEWNGVAFLGNVVTSRINVDRIEWKGSTPVGKELPDFLVSDDPWFRPVDIKLGPDGALYVSDFYNKIIGHYEVDLKHPGRDKNRGRIWRIVHTGKKGEPAKTEFARKDWTVAKDDELLADFAHPNTSVRLTAANEAKQRGAKFQANSNNINGEPALTQGGLMFTVSGFNPDWKRQNYRLVIEMWKSVKVPADAQDGMIVRAFTTMKEWGEAERKAVLEVFNTFDSVRVKRAVIDGITAHPHEQFIDPLLAFAREIPSDDTHMRHAAKIALRNSLDVAPKSALNLKPRLGANPADYRPLVDALLGCSKPLPAAVLLDMYSSGVVPDELAFEVGRRMGRVADRNLLPLIPMTSHPKSDEDYRVMLRTLAGVLRGAVEGGHNSAEQLDKDDPLFRMVSRTIDLARTAIVKRPAVAALALEVVREAKPFHPAPGQLGSAMKADRLLAELLADERATPEQKVVAAEVMLMGGGKVDRAAVHILAESEPPHSTVIPRLVAALMANSPTTADCALAAHSMKTAPYTQAVTYAVGLAGDKFGADLLLASIGKGEAPARLLQEKAVVDRLKATGVKDLDARLKDLTRNIPPAEKRVEDLLKARAAGFPKAKSDATKGKAVFTKNCAVCHQLNNEGAKVGPQLDGIGIRGAARLMEDTLDPSRHVDAAFRATKLELKDGNTLTGLVREDGAVYVLVDGTGKEQRIPTADVDKKTTTSQSAMPANLDTVMKEDEYYHLLAFLLDQKPKK